MDYLERNIKDTSSTTNMVPAPRVQGSTIIFFAMVAFWTLAVIAWRFIPSING